MKKTKYQVTFEIEYIDETWDDELEQLTKELVDSSLPSGWSGTEDFSTKVISVTKIS